MIILDGANEKLQIITSASADIEPKYSYVENNAGAFTPAGATLASVVTNTTQDIVGVPGSSKQRAITYLSFRNNHASQSCDVTVQTNDGTNTASHIKVTLLAGEALIYLEGGGWTHYDSNGGAYPATGMIATQSDMEAATDNTKVVTPLAMNWHPGIAKFWAVFTGNSTTVLASWNLTSITDGTSEATVTIATDFSSANWCVQATAIGTASTVAAARLACARALAAGTVIVFCVDGAATTALQDPTTWCVAGFGDQ